MSKTFLTKKKIANDSLYRFFLHQFKKNITAEYKPINKQEKYLIQFIHFL